MQATGARISETDEDVLLNHRYSILVLIQLSKLSPPVVMRCSVVNEGGSFADYHAL